MRRQPDAMARTNGGFIHTPLRSINGGFNHTLTGISGIGCIRLHPVASGNNQQWIKFVTAVQFCFKLTEERRLAKAEGNQTRLSQGKATFHQLRPAFIAGCSSSFRLN